MGVLTILQYYIGWHYTRAIADFFLIQKNFFIFIYNFFSIDTLFFSLLSPWRRLGDVYTERMTLEDRAGTFVVNMIMRCVGAIIRIFFICAGISSLIGFGIVSIIGIVAWLALPALLGYIVFWSVGVFLI